MIKEILITASIIIGGGTSAGGSIKNNNQPLAATWDYVNDLEDGAVYFIRNALLDTKVIDVPNSDYSNGKDLAIYSSNGWNNQRFVLNKEATTDGKVTYSFSPVEDYNKVLAIEGDNSNENKVLELRNQSNYVSNVNSYKFVFTPGSTANSFRISTGASNFSKYLTLQNYSVANSTKVVQKTYDSNYEKYFDWYLQKTDSLGVNVENEAEINGTELYHYNVRVPVTGIYVFETSKFDKELDTKLYLYKADGTFLTSNDDVGNNRFSRIQYTLDSSISYWIKLTGYNSYQVGKVYLTLKSLNTVYINTYYKENDIDTRPDGVSPREDLSNKGYYVRHIVNAKKKDMLITDKNGFARFNNKYYMLASHGSYYGVVYIGPDENFYKQELPDLSNVILSVWAVCYGGREGNIAQYSVVNRNAQNSLGFPGITYGDTSKTFTDKLWEEIANGKSVQASVDSALSHTKSSHWFSHMFGWGDDTIVSPQLYSRTMTKMVNENNLSYSQKLPIISSGLSSSNKDSLNSFIKENETKTFAFDDGSIIMKFVDGLPTNDYFVINRENNFVRKHIVNLSNETNVIKANTSFEKFSLNSNQRITLQNEFNLVIDGIAHKIRRVQYVTTKDEFETLNEVYFDVNTNERFSEQQILDAFTK